MTRRGTIATVERAKQVFGWVSISPTEGAYFPVDKRIALSVLNRASAEDFLVDVEDGTVWLGAPRVIPSYAAIRREVEEDVPF